MSVRAHCCWGLGGHTFVHKAPRLTEGLSLHFSGTAAIAPIIAAVKDGKSVTYEGREVRCSISMMFYYLQGGPGTLEKVAILLRPYSHHFQGKWNSLDFITWLKDNMGSLIWTCPCILALGLFCKLFIRIWGGGGCPPNRWILSLLHQLRQTPLDGTLGAWLKRVPPCSLPGCFLWHLKNFRANGHRPKRTVHAMPASWPRQL